MATQWQAGCGRTGLGHEGQPGWFWTSWEHFACVQPFDLKNSPWSDLVGQCCEVDEAEVIASALEMNRLVPREVMVSKLTADRHC